MFYLVTLYFCCLGGATPIKIEDSDEDEDRSVNVINLANSKFSHKL